MRYLVTTTDNPPFYTESFEPDNHFNQDVGMVVFDLYHLTFMTNGKDWNLTEIDHL